MPTPSSHSPSTHHPQSCPLPRYFKIFLLNIAVFYLILMCFNMQVFEHGDDGQASDTPLSSNLQFLRQTTAYYRASSTQAVSEVPCAEYLADVERILQVPPCLHDSHCRDTPFPHYMCDPCLHYVCAPCSSHWWSVLIFITTPFSYYLVLRFFHGC